MHGLDGPTNLNKYLPNARQVQYREVPTYTNIRTSQPNCPSRAPPDSMLELSLMACCGIRPNLAPQPWSGLGSLAGVRPKELSIQGGPLLAATQQLRRGNTGIMRACVKWSYNKVPFLIHPGPRRLQGCGCKDHLCAGWPLSVSVPRSHLLFLSWM